MSMFNDLFKNNSIAETVGETLSKVGDIADRFIHTKEDKEAFIKEMKQLTNEEVANARANETARDTNEFSSWLSKNIHEIIALLVIGCWIISWFVVTVVPVQVISSAVMLILGYLYGKSQPDKGL